MSFFTILVMLRHILVVCYYGWFFLVSPVPARLQRVHTCAVRDDIPGTILVRQTLQNLSVEDGNLPCGVGLPEKHPSHRFERGDRGLERCEVREWEAKFGV